MDILTLIYYILHYSQMKIKHEPFDQRILYHFLSIQKNVVKKRMTEFLTWTQRWCGN